MTRRNMFGWIPDDSDERDYSFAKSVGDLFAKQAPPSWSNRDSLPKAPYEQALPNCVTQSFVLSAEMLEQQAKRPEGKRAKRSVAFLHFFGRAYSGDSNRNVGTHPRLVFKAAQRLGAPPEHLWPENKPFNKQPNAGAICAAYAFRYLKYSRLTSVEEVRRAMASCFPVVAGLNIDQSFVNGEAGVIYDPPAPSKVVGRHMVTLFEYGPMVFRLRNSWGKDWGINGEGLLSEAYLAEAVEGDVYAIHF